MSVEVIVKCVGCQHSRPLKPEETGKPDPPMCEKCFSPMYVDSASS